MPAAPPAALLGGFRKRLAWRIAGFMLAVLISASSARYFVKSAHSDEPITNHLFDGNSLERPAQLLAQSAERLDFGTISQRGGAAETITIVNRSSKPVRLARMTTSCPCLIVDVPTQALLPGESSVVQVRLDLTKIPSVRSPTYTVPM